MNNQKTKLSVNVNKIAALRNARGKNIPDLARLAKIILQTKAHGLTIHPRPDERHIRKKDVFQLKSLLEGYPKKELNIEGYPSPTFLKLVQSAKPDQATLVPDPPEALTSDSGWDFVKNKALLKRAAQRLKESHIRISLFLDPLSMDERQYEALAEIQPDRIELFTESYAESFGAGQTGQTLPFYQKAAARAKALGLGINAGHDLSQKNLFDLLKALPDIKEISIGQALIAEALEEGLSAVIKKYLNIIDQAFSLSQP